MPMVATGPDVLTPAEPKLLGPATSPVVNFGTFSELEALRKAERAEKYKSYTSQYSVGYSSGSTWDTKTGKWIPRPADPAAAAVSKEDREAVDREMSIACAWDPDGVPCGGTVCGLPGSDTGDCSEGWVDDKGENAPEVEDVPAPDLLQSAADEVIGQIRLYVAEIQSCAHRFEKSPDANTLDDLMDASDGLSGFILGITNGD